MSAALPPPAAMSPAPRRRAARGFSLIEVILAIGILAVALVTLLGLIGPTLGFVKTVIDTNAAIACISKMNTQIESSPFYSNITPAVENGSVYTWVAKSKPTSPTVFFFYDEVVSGVGASPEVVVPRVALYLDGADAATAKGVTSVSALNGSTEGSLQNAVASTRVRGPVIAMSVSLSPLAQNMPPPLGGATGIYASSGGTGIFPANDLEGKVGRDPNAASGGGATATIRYPEAYLPMLIQVFTVSSDSLGLSGVGSGAGQLNPATDLNESNRLFTYTTAKVR